jgi:hypothetical protein
VSTTTKRIVWVSVGACSRGGRISGFSGSFAGAPIVLSAFLFLVAGMFLRTPPHRASGLCGCTGDAALWHLRDVAVRRLASLGGSRSYDLVPNIPVEHCIEKRTRSEARCSHDRQYRPLSARRSHRQVFPFQIHDHGTSGLGWPRSISTGSTAASRPSRRQEMQLLSQPY